VLKRGGVLLAGSPVVPEPFSRLAHRWLRRKMNLGTTGPNGHINCFSVRDWELLIRQSGLAPELVTGTHFMRASGMWVENFAFWAKLNLAWGALWPALGSELFLMARKP
jgi:hypothetical protein